ncbi:unnamed protein product [Clonostachys solani]|uniref:Uncharacterized protein n=1 Tax=Clonostachys solani TaxID=160281 RepID=A0A9N9ZLI1_9HYPO|nr:unnamed protein product [Clonostachys solani]
MQNCVTTGVNVVQTRASFTQNAHGSRAPGERRRLNGIAQPWVTLMDIGAAIEKQLDYVAVAKICCQGKRPVVGSLHNKALVE